MVFRLPSVVLQFEVSMYMYYVCQTQISVLTSQTSERFPYFHVLSLSGTYPLRLCQLRAHETCCFVCSQRRLRATARVRRAPGLP